MALWFSWLVATALGRLLAEAVTEVIMRRILFAPMMLGDISPRLAGSLSVGLGGLALGLAQWLVVRIWVRGGWPSLTWVVVTGLALGLGEAVGSAVAGIPPIAGMIPPGSLLLGTLVGLGQWVPLRSWLNHASGWIGVVALSWIGADLGVLPLPPELSFAGLSGLGLLLVLRSQPHKPVPSELQIRAPG